ncbi:YihY/virulence factor BrkB family protein [Rhizobium halophytocola]|uniref:Membrane protein n=1 Tax=Rhizobium halophytocola TaxID=735519 RepID=A0ABS4E5N4_9HYPH|nr:YihY/virulence factor BrkB family protein [Rhizobium halophytocola]MBP1853254.1 membrane protein [Rhizobium halophytocola]
MKLEFARGRDAERPGEIPAHGLIDVAWRVWNEISDDRITLIAAGVTYYALLAIFPALSMFVSVYGLLADPTSIVEHARAVTSFLPADTVGIFIDQLQALASQKASTLSFGVAASLIFALWSAHNGILSIFSALNAVYGEKEQRGILRLNGMAMLFTLGTILAAIVVIFAIAAVPIILRTIWLGSLTATLTLIGRWPLLAILAILGSAMLYRFGPSREPAQFKWLSWGSVFTGLGWCAVSAGYSLYLDHFANYQATYGTLGALIGFMVWVWLSVIVLLVGAEINAELEHQTEIDTTTGAPLPMGQRGAYVADTVGEAIM